MPPGPHFVQGATRILDPHASRHCPAPFIFYDTAMAIIRDAAIVLARLDFSETSQVLVFFTREHGKIRAIGKGLKRGTKTRFAVGIDLLEHGRLAASVRQEHSGALATVTEWVQTESLAGLRRTLSCLYSAQYLAEITAHLTEDGDPHMPLFDALVERLVELGSAPQPLAVVVDYQRTLLECIGSHPRFDGCVLCGRETDLTYFSAHQGGMICRHCEAGQVEKREVSAATLESLRGDASPTSPAGPFVLLDYHIAHLMGRQPLLTSKLITRAQQRSVL